MVWLRTVEAIDGHKAAALAVSRPHPGTVSNFAEEKDIQDVQLGCYRAESDVPAGGDIASSPPTPSPLPWFTLPLSPAYYPGWQSLPYSVEVPLICRVLVPVIVTRSKPTGTISHVWNMSDPTSGTSIDVAIAAGEKATFPFPLTQTMQETARWQIHSTIDGDVDILVTRAAPSVTNLKLIDMADASFSSLALDPSFDPPTFNYAAPVLSASHETIHLVANSAMSDDLTACVDETCSAASIASSWDGVTVSLTTGLTLVNGINRVLLKSHLDGDYSVDVRRLSIASLAFEAMSVTGERRMLDSLCSTPPMTQLFNDGPSAFSCAIPPLISAIRVKVEIVGGSGVHVQDHAAPSSMHRVNDNEWSNWLAVSSGAAGGVALMLDVISFMDDFIYSFSFVHANPALQDVTFVATAASFPFPHPLTLTPPFQADVFDYTLTVLAVDTDVMMKTAHDGVLKAAYIGELATMAQTWTTLRPKTQYSYSLGRTVAVSPDPLRIGSMHLHLSSDGRNMTYSFGIVRQAPHIMQMSVIGIRAPNNTVETLPLNPPVFDPFTTKYNLTVPVPFSLRAMKLILTFNSSMGSCNMERNGTNHRFNLTSTVPSVAFPLAVAANGYEMNSFVDGIFTLTINQLHPHISHVALSSPNAATETIPLVNRGHVRIFDPTKWNYSTLVQPTWTMIDVKPTVATPSTFIPPFIEINLTQGTTHVLQSVTNVTNQQSVRFMLNSSVLQSSPLKLHFISAIDGDYQIDLLTPPQPTSCTPNPCMNYATCTMLQPGSTPSFNCTCQPGYVGLLCETETFPQPSQPIIPVAVIGATNEYTGCQSALILDGSTSYGLDPAVPSERRLYEWAVESLTDSNGHIIYNRTASDLSSFWPASVPDLLRLLWYAADPDGVGALLSIPRSQLMDGLTYTFSLRYGNVLAISQHTYATVAVKFQTPESCIPWLPALSISVQNGQLRRPSRNTFMPRYQFAQDQPQPPAEVSYEYAWSMVRIDDPTQAWSWNNTDEALSVEAYTLHVGARYRVSLSVVVTGPAPVESGLALQRRLLVATSANLHATLDVTVHASMLSASVIGGDRTRLMSDVITVNGSMSWDPDAGPQPVNVYGVTYPFSFKWTILSVKSGTVVPLPPSSASSSPALTLPENFFTATGEYRITLSIVSFNDTSRSASSSILLTVDSESGSSLRPTLLLLMDSQFVPRQYSIRIRSNILSHTVPIDQLKYEWSAPGRANLDLMNHNLVLTGFYASSLTIKGGRLLPGPYTFMLTACDPNRAGAADACGSASIDVVVLSGPVGGSCTLNPTNGTAYTTEFVASCSAWTSAEGMLPLLYSFTFLDTDMNGHVQVLPVRADAALPSATFHLPPSNNGSVQVSIRDTLGTTSTVLLSVHVSPRSDSCSINQELEANLQRSLTDGDEAGALTAANDLIAMTLSVNDGKTMDPDVSLTCITLTIRKVLAACATAIRRPSAVPQPSSSLLVASLLPSILSLSPILPNSTASFADASALATFGLDGLKGANAESAILPSKLAGSDGLLTRFAQSLSLMLTECAKFDAINQLMDTLLCTATSHTSPDESIGPFYTHNFNATIVRTLLSGGVDLNSTDSASAHLQLSPNATRALDELINSINMSTIDSSTASLPLDTQLVHFASDWRECRPGSGNLLVDLTSIKLMIACKAPAYVQSDITLVTSSAVAHTIDACGRVVPPPPLDSLTLNDVQCVHWDEATQQYSNDGCSPTKITIINDGTQAAVSCSCDTAGSDYSVVFIPPPIPDCDDTGSSIADYGSMNYLVWLVLYAILTFGAIVRSILTTCNNRGAESSWHSTWRLLVAEHGLIVMVGLLRCLQMLVYHSFFDSIAYAQLIALHILVYLPYSWLFTYLAYTIDDVYHRVSERDDRGVATIQQSGSDRAAISSSAEKKGLVTKYESMMLIAHCRKSIIMTNIVISCILVALCVIMASTDSSVLPLDTWSRIGDAITMAVYLAFAFAVSAYAKKLFVSLGHFVSHGSSTGSVVILKRDRSVPALVRRRLLVCVVVFLCAVAAAVFLCVAAFSPFTISDSVYTLLSHIYYGSDLLLLSTLLFIILAGCVRYASISSRVSKRRPYVVRRRMRGGTQVDRINQPSSGEEEDEDEIDEDDEEHEDAGADDDGSGGEQEAAAHDVPKEATKNACAYAASGSDAYAVSVAAAIPLPLSRPPTASVLSRHSVCPSPSVRPSRAAPASEMEMATDQFSLPGTTMVDQNENENGGEKLATGETEDNASAEGGGCAHAIEIGNTQAGVGQAVGSSSENAAPTDAPSSSPLHMIDAASTPRRASVRKHSLKSTVEEETDQPTPSRQQPWVKHAQDGSGWLTSPTMSATGGSPMLGPSQIVLGSAAQPGSPSFGVRSSPSVAPGSSSFVAGSPSFAPLPPSSVNTPRRLSARGRSRATSSTAVAPTSTLMPTVTAVDDASVGNERPAADASPPPDASRRSVAALNSDDDDGVPASHP